MPVLDHPTLPLVKAAFPGVKLQAAEFRGRTTLVVPPERVHEVMRFLRADPACSYDFLSDVVGIDYLDYPAKQPGRFAVVYLLASYGHGRRLAVKVCLDPTRDTSGIERDPALVREDVLDDFTSIELAREAYGVVFRDERTLEIDSEATAALRAELAAKRNGGSLTAYYESRGLPPSSAPTSVAANREFGIE